MRLLVIYRHFWPDSPPYATMLREIAAHLVRDGHDVTVLTEQPSYKVADRAQNAARFEAVDGVEVHRLGRGPGRRIAALLFPVRALWTAMVWRLRGRRFDVVWTATMPPAVNGLGARGAAWLLGARFVYHCQDIYPELQVFAGNWTSSGLLARIVGWIDHANTRAADRVIVLSRDMAQTIQARGIGAKKIAVVNNFMLSDFEGPPPAPAAKPEGVFRVIFAGNIGRFQGLETLIGAARLLDDGSNRIEIMIMGEGAEEAALRRSAQGLRNVQFVPHRPFRDAAPTIATADLALVALKPGIYRAAFPSKTLTYLGLGVPVLAMIEAESELARTLLTEGIGRVVPYGDPAAMAAEIRAAADAQNNGTRNRVARYHASHLSVEAALSRWSALVSEVGAA
ncbi:Glycosyltransferase involved in cell wall bisynthesis [Palleronia marisminoris]|uniref:Putative glycosyl transferase n=1 Tax=Palleronia marisminoris TaxID=315423 RepID=A0A1Y5T2U2_9RHOB|nr:glycosyltransferase family 4 protein [Palleronia marisminoris]SFH05903.1 Glycosyltransferase involved in cell wall bisynthesis [Palleronia marisminoris]SLN50968.1 putative glycosyl transferase [Palleronia marisminoris]